MSNAAFYQHYPLAERYAPLPLPRQQDLIDAGFLSNGKAHRCSCHRDDVMQVVTRAYAFWYVGDYDSAAWLYGQLQPKWDDPSAQPRYARRA